MRSAELMRGANCSRPRRPILNAPGSHSSTSLRSTRWRSGSASGGLQGEAKRDQRVLEAKPKVEAFFAFVDAAFAELGLLPATPFTKALGYVRDRKDALSVFLEDPEVAPDITSSVRCGSCPWGARIGCSAGPNSAPVTLASRRA